MFFYRLSFFLPYQNLLPIYYEHIQSILYSATQVKCEIIQKLQSEIQKNITRVEMLILTLYDVIFVFHYAYYPQTLD
ncbi:hypothetical protein TCEA9_24900 [Thermobrachium celere]|nr:hypothetical protein TCEA9_24900 [Thermobrachium celere]